MGWGPKAKAGVAGALRCGAKPVAPTGPKQETHSGRRGPQKLGYFFCTSRSRPAGTDSLGAGLVDRNPLGTFRND